VDKFKANAPSWQEELAACRVNFFKFLRYAAIVEAPTQDNPGGVIPVQMWPHLEKFAKMLLTQRLVIILKAKQVGVSWMMALYALWFVLFHKGANILVFSIGEKEAIEFIRKCKRAYQYLPQWMQLPIDKDNDLEFSFKGMMSSIKGFSGDQRAGIGESASIVIYDEMDFHNMVEENWHAVQPTISGGGQFVGVSTIDPFSASSLFKGMCRQAMEGLSPFKFNFFPWDCRPDRDADWYQKQKETVTMEQIGKLSRELYMAKNFPATAEEALAPVGAISACNPEILQNMMENTSKPIRKSGIINYYQNYHIGDAYVCGTDASGGIGKDFAVSIIVNVKTGRVVSDIMRSDIKPNELAEQTKIMCSEYRNPLWVVEDDPWGMMVIKTALDLNYGNLYYRDKKKGKCGFEIKEYNRNLVWGQMVVGVDDGMISTPNREGVKQLQTLIRNPTKEGRIEAQVGAHDDYPAALMLWWAVRDKVKSRKAEAGKSFNYITGRRG